MNTTTREQSRRLAQYWQQQISAWAQSGQTQKSFCKQHDLDYHRFGYWRRKLQSTSKPADRNTHRGGFVSVQPVPVSAAGGLCLMLPNGIKIQGIDEDNMALVTQLLRQLS